MSFFANMKRFDAYSKSDSVTQQKSMLGATITILSSAIMVMLLLSEFLDYRSVVTKEGVKIDEGYGVAKMPVAIDISMHRLKCEDVNIDIDDRKGHHDVHVSDTMTKTPIQIEDGAQGCRLSGKFSISRVAGTFILPRKEPPCKGKGRRGRTHDGPACLPIHDV